MNKNICKRYMLQKDNCDFFFEYVCIVITFGRLKFYHIDCTE